MASTSNQIVSSDSSSSSTFRWSVFLSFRGIDTRNNFTGHLYMALKQAGILTFMDDPELRKGEDLSAQLLKAIKESKVSIVVFSKEYASSRWCLEELVEILECRRRNKQLVLPVFYDVEASVVRHQTMSFATAFERHENRYATKLDKVEKWRSALTEASDLSGYNLKNDANGNEAKLIKQIIEETAKKLNQEFLHVARHPVGIESRVEEFNKLLSLEKSNDVRIIAIWGVGGIGKTTAAKAVYNRISIHFEDRCFLADIAQTSTQPNGVVTLQNQLISNVLKHERLKVDNCHQGIEVIKRQVWRRRLLIVLDDIDNVEQLENLGIDRNLFHAGSRIIVTTRDLSCLSLLDVNDVYTPEELNKSESLELFSCYAFGQDHPKEGYEEISEEVVDCAGGLPLVLAIWGPYMKSFKSVEHWQRALKKLKKIPHNDVQGKLKVSFDSLDDIGKQLFLDIACFFIGMSKDFTVKVLEDEDLGCLSDIEIEALASRSLVSFDKLERVSMHDMIRDMGREIVRQESLKFPGKRSRLWDRVDVLPVLKRRLGTETIEGIELKEADEEQVDGETFEKMSELRLLILGCFRLQGTFINSSEKLKWLCWHGFPMEFIPSSLYMDNLVAIDLPNSTLKQIWEGPKSLERLRFLNLSHSYMLTISPDLSGAKNLEQLVFRDCSNLVELHSSAGCLDKLVVLNLNNCASLTKVPLSIFGLKSLEDLDLSGCSKLGYEEPLHLLPASIQGLSCIKRLMLRQCNVLHVPSEIGSLQTLQELDLSENQFSNLPDSISNLHCLMHLFLENCVGLISIPDLPRNLQGVYANNCPSLERVSVASQWDKGPFMDFSDCPKLVNNFANNFRRNLLQSYQGRPEIPGMNISVSETEIPNWCNYQSMGLILSFLVPSYVGRKLQGWIMCLVTSGGREDHVICVVKNMTKDTNCHFDTRIRGCMWLSYVALSDHGFLVEGGDEIEISFSTNKRVNNCGISLIFEGDEKDPERDDQLVIEYSAPVNFIRYGHVAYTHIRRTYSDGENLESFFDLMDLVNKATEDYWRNEAQNMGYPEGIDPVELWGNSLGGGYPENWGNPFGGGSPEN